MKGKIIVILLSCCFFSSCMVTEVFPKKEFKEELPLNLEKNVYISNVFFLDTEENIHLVLWKFEIVYRFCKKIRLNFTNGNTYFPKNKTVDVESMKILMKNGKEVNIISKKIEQSSIYSVMGRIDNNGLVGVTTYPDGREEFFTDYSAPEDCVGKYYIDLEFEEKIKLKQADSIIIKVLITEDGETTEVTKILHFDMKYGVSTESMIGAWIRSF